MIFVLVSHVEPQKDADLDADAHAADCLRRNRQGMGGNQNRGNDDPFAKAKFSMIPFAGNADPEAYLDWEIVVDQKFKSHLVLEEHRIRLATIEFTDFVLFWWSDLCDNNNATALPQTWTALKQRMKSCFVPPYYKLDLCLKLQHLNQGSNSEDQY